MTNRPIRLATGALVALALLAAGCGDDGDDTAVEADVTTTSTTGPTIPDDLTEGDEPRTDIELVCTGGPFTLDALDSPDGVPDGVETEEGPAADALRQLLASAEADGTTDVPDRTWREMSTVTTDDYTIHEFAHGSPPDLWVASVQELGDDRWQGEFVQPCTPRPWLDGDLAGYWWPADDAEVADETTEIAVLVQEDSCDSGRGPEGRVGEPVITYGADVVVVTFPVEPRDEDGVFTCQAHPPAQVTIELDQPLAGRTLLDGSTWPAQEPADEPTES